MTDCAMNMTQKGPVSVQIQAKIPFFALSQTDEVETLEQNGLVAVCYVHVRRFGLAVSH